MMKYYDHAASAVTGALIVVPGGHGLSSPNRDLQALGPVSRRRRRRRVAVAGRAWKASTPAITSSVTGFK